MIRFLSIQIITEPDPGNQKLTDPDTEHCVNLPSDTGVPVAMMASFRAQE
jgi:hypothetical protein